MELVGQQNLLKIVGQNGSHLFKLCQSGEF